MQQQITLSIMSYATWTDMQEVISNDSVEQSYPEAYHLSKTTLQQLQWTDPGWQDPSGALELKDANRLLEPGYLEFEDGYARLADGSIHCAVLTPLPQCTGQTHPGVCLVYLRPGQMVSWWFRFCDDSLKYRLWHLRDHVEGQWSEDYYRVKAVSDRGEGHHVGHSHIVSEYVGGRLTRLHIDFKDPHTILDTTRFREAGVCACLVARVNMMDDPLAGDTAVGHLIHLVRARPDGQGCEMRSRFWMGDVSHNTGGVLPAAWVNYIGNSRLGRLLRASGSLGRDLHRHCHEEMRCLAAILPALYDAHGGGGK